MVGILIKLIPLRYVDAQKPPMSVRTPPPRFIRSDFLSALNSLSLSHIRRHDSIFLFSSPDLIIILLNLLTPDFSLKISKQNLSVLSSTKINIEEYLAEFNFSFSNEY